MTEKRRDTVEGLNRRISCIHRRYSCKCDRCAASGSRRRSLHQAAQQALGTATKKDTVNAALREVAALAARRRNLQRLISRSLPDLEDEDVMRAAWLR